MVPTEALFLTKIKTNMCVVRMKDPQLTRTLFRQDDCMITKSGHKFNCSYYEPLGLYCRSRDNLVVTINMKTIPETLMNVLRKT